MSDEIKTQHGAIGLLMAEVAQLRRDLAAEEQRHHSACDDWIRERRRADKLQAELAQAKADLEWGKSLWDWLRDMLPDSGLCLEIDTEDLMELAQKHGRAKRVLFDPEIHGFIEAEPGDQIWWWGDDVAPKREAMNNCKECDHLKSDLAQAKRLLRNIVSNLHCNEDIDQELYDAAEFLKGTSGSTPDRPAITN